MDFQISHITEYDYEHPAAEAYLEARLHVPSHPWQEVHEQKILIDPVTPTSGFVDYFGNRVEFFSLPFRHISLRLENQLRVTTAPRTFPSVVLDIPVQECRQIFSSVLTEVFDYLQPTRSVPLGRESTQWAKRYLRGDKSIGESLHELNKAIFEHFLYKSGTTTNSTPLATIWKHQRGVCQDFAHVMLSILRTAGLPARYVCGYIETDPPRDAAGKPKRRLIGAVATHAWVEVLLPGMTWYPLDPTNNQISGERHVTIAYGRDFSDATPVRGTFKGTGRQRMRVKVFMKREKKSALKPAGISV